MKRRRMLAVGMVAGVVILVAGVAAAINPGNAPVKYSAPFICGWLPPVPPDLDQHAKPGDYHTAIMIHNHTGTNVTAGKQVMLSFRMGAPPAPPTPFFNASIPFRRTLQIDCVDIWAMAGVPPGSFVKGHLLIGLNQPLPVSATYTSQTHDDPNVGPGPAAGHSIDVEQIFPIGGAPVG